MNPQWSSRLTWCGTFILMGGFVALLASLSAPRADRAEARSIEIPPAAQRASNPELSEALQAPAMGSIALSNADLETSLPSVFEAPVTAAAPDIAPTPPEPKPFVVASINPSSKLPTETAPVPVTIAPVTNVPTTDLLPNVLMVPVSRLEAPEDCLLADICIDQYLWALYQRTPKQDTNKVVELRKVTIKRKGKTRIVTRGFTKLVDADFTWKDPKAADKVGKPLSKYVIGGMDRTFKRKLLYMLLAAEEAGLSPGITSAFRDDYRQAIAAGQKAASNRSYHGGSLRGGYGHGLAADVVSLKGTTRSQRWVSSDLLWKWIDENGKQFGIGRPYLHRDAPHVAPIDGREYATHYRAPKIQVAKVDKTKRDQPAAQAGKSPDDKSKTQTASALPDSTRTIFAAVEFNARRDQ
jgi:hypothetical protein